METKLSNDELQQQLDIIERQRKNIKDELFYKTYSDLTFFKIWKKCNNWKSIIINCILIDFIFCILSSSNLLLFTIAIPFIFILASLSNALEVKSKISYLKKKLID